MLTGEGFARLFDPLAVLGDKGLDLSGPGTLWYDNLDATAWINLYRQSSCPRTLTYVKARLEAGLVGFWEQ